jgi:hypothetical protein
MARRIHFVLCLLFGNRICGRHDFEIFSLSLCLTGLVYSLYVAL